MAKVTNTILKLILAYISLFIPNSVIENELKSHPKIEFSQLMCESVSDIDNNISAITYNVWGLPIWIPGQDQSERFNRISDSIASRDFELICLQEVFNKKVRKALLNKLSLRYFRGSDYECNEPIIGKLIQRDCNGGLMTLSKYPIINETFYKFSTTQNTSLIERIGNKGFLFTTILRNGELINIINTHLYSGSSQISANNRMNQILEMQQILSKQEEYYKYPTLLFGDLNITHPFLVDSNGVFNSTHAYDYLTTEMNFVDTALELDENSYTINTNVNVFCPSKTPKQKLDYIMIHMPPNYENSIWLSDQSTEFQGKSAMSDHMGWKAIINIQGNRNTHKSDLNP